MATHQPPEAVRQALDRLAVPYEILPCEPELADTAVFCRHYGYSLENSANCLLVASKRGEKKYAACVILATTKVDNRTVRQRLGSSRVSFASVEDARSVTGMELGGVTPLALPETLPVWVDERVMACESLLLGGGNRYCKIKITPEVFNSMPNARTVAELANWVEQ